MTGLGEFYENMCLGVCVSTLLGPPPLPGIPEPESSQGPPDGQKPLPAPRPLMTPLMPL